jgi:hypothetical protein
MEAAQPQIQEARRRRAAAGLSRERQMAAMDLMRSPDAEARARGLAQMRDLAATSPDAAMELARCIRMQCAPDAGNPEDAQELMRDAARAGSDRALYELSARAWRPVIATVGGTSVDTLQVSGAEQYGWARIIERLNADGCLGLGRFQSWAFAQQPPASDRLTAMSPAEEREARRIAADMMANELPIIRRNMACEETLGS